MGKQQESSGRNVRRGASVLVAALALTVFMTSLVIENRDDNALYRAVSGDGLKAIPVPEAVQDAAGAPQVSRADALLIEGHKFFHAGNRSGAVELYKSALRLEPDNPDILRALGFVSFEQKKYAVAEGHIQRFVELVPDCHPMWYARLGFAQMQNGKFPQALENLQVPLKHQPDDGALHFALACVHSGMKDLDQGFAHLEKARELLGMELLRYLPDPHLENLRRTARFQEFLRTPIARDGHAAVPVQLGNPAAVEQ